MKSNSLLEGEVLQELLFEPGVISSNIFVAANNGVVRLAGRVANYAEKLAAEEATQRVQGVKSVIEDIEVISTRSYTVNDSKIADAVANARS